MRPIDADAIEYEKQSLETDRSIEWLSVAKEDIDAMPTLYDLKDIRQEIDDIPTLSFSVNAVYKADVIKVINKYIQKGSNK